jgi:hypothetical protein
MMGKREIPETSRRDLLQAGAAFAALSITGGAQGAVTEAAPLLEFTGPIPVTETSKPWGTANVPGSPRKGLVDQYHYVEEEYFLAGTANVYGPGSRVPLRPGQPIYDLKPLAALVRSDVPFKTRVMILRPRDPARFSGNVHLVANHNLDAMVSVERNLLRNGDVWMGLEVNSGARFGVEERPSGGIANLLSYDPKRYAGLSIPAGMAADWPDLTPGRLSKAFKTIDFGRENDDFHLFLQELHRSWAQAPDIMTKLAVALRSNAPNSPLKGYRVRRIYSNGRSGQTVILSGYINFHHNAATDRLGYPPFDGYLVRVGIVTAGRPKGAVLVLLESEAETIVEAKAKRPAPPDTDEPRFRYYELPGTGHGLTARPIRTGPGQGLGAVVPHGVQGISDMDGGKAAYQVYDKINLPIIWGVWDNIYRWVETGVPMPRAPRVTRDASAPDGIARDKFGNALGGIRTPWVDVPDARYIARIAEKNPLEAGMEPFSAEKMKALYGSQAAYLAKVDRRIQEMVREGWIAAGDAPLMRKRGVSEALYIGYEGG